MRSEFSKYLSKEEWLIREKGWSQEKLRVSETNFTLGNGYLGSRGIYEEIPDGSEPGTYIAGVYDEAGAMVSELVNAPNPIDFRIAVEGEKLDMGRMNIVENERILDMQKGLLVRKTIFSDTRGRRFLYQSLRFFSLNDFHVGGMQVYLTALDAPARIIVQDTIDDSVTNIGGILEGRKRHTQLVDVSSTNNTNYMCVKTYIRKLWIAYTSFLAVQRGRGQGVGTLNKIFNISLGKKETVCFTKIFTIYTSRHISHKKIKAIALRDSRKAVSMGFETLLNRHIGEWKNRWKISDIKIKGDSDAEKALRFNIYHLIISGKEGDYNASIGARTLSGDGYRGHIFWDTEIFILPFFIYTNPELAGNLLKYRYHRLPQARLIAKEKGYKGALFPWESADRGIEVTPPYAKNLDGTIIEIKTMNMEHHIVCDIAYGAWHYFSASGDINFMIDAGLEIMIETARFWASRVVYDEKSKKYSIKGVIGPDEFHENVDNNMYTNGMARWNLIKAKECFEYFEKVRPRHVKRLKRKLGIHENEFKSWKNIVENIRIPFSKSKNIFEEFDNYLRKKDILLTKYDTNYMPMIPKNVEVRGFDQTQLVKQADVMMIMYLLTEEFTHDEKVRNYSYYIKRTLHKSSLSPSIYSIMASEVGDSTRAYVLFLVSLYADLKNNHGNTGEGIHAASLGGTWQAAIMGFAGFRIIDEMPSFEPRLPGHWQGMEFSLKWKGHDLRVDVQKENVKIFVTSKNPGYILIKCFNSVHKILFNKKYIFKK